MKERTVDDQDRWRSIAKRAMAIITDAIMHGMPITPEVADLLAALGAK